MSGLSFVRERMSPSYLRGLTLCGNLLGAPASPTPKLAAATTRKASATKKRKRKTAQASRRKNR